MPAYFENGVFARTAAWHRLGTVVDAEHFTPAEGYELCPEFASPVDVTPLVARLPDLSEVEVPEQYGLVRRSDRKCLGTGGAQFIQGLINGPELVDVLRQVVGDNVKLDAIMTLAGGTKLVAQVALRNYEVAGDEHRAHVAIATGMGGILRTSLMHTATRVVCANTLAMALKDSCASIKHTKNHDLKLADAAEALAAVLEVSKEQEITLNAMAARQVSAAEVDALFRATLGAKPEGELATRTANNMQELARLYEEGDEVASRHTGTLYGAFQACTNYSNHGIVVRGEYEDRESGRLAADGYARRVDSTLFGKGAEVSERALQAATAILATPFTR